MKKYYLIGLVLLSLLFVATAKAELLTFTQDMSKYQGGAHTVTSTWGFDSFTGKKEGNGKGANTPAEGYGSGWFEWTYNLKDADNNTTTALFEGWNYNGGNGSNDPVVSAGTTTAWHNSANTYRISFAEAVIDSFYISFDFWSSSSAGGFFDLEVWYWDLEGELQKYEEKNVINGNEKFFLGFYLEEGAYLQSVMFSSVANGTGNNGYDFCKGDGLGFRNDGLPDYEPPVKPSGGVNSTPEPATLLILGLGTIGVGFITRRRMSK